MDENPLRFLTEVYAALPNFLAGLLQLKKINLFLYRALRA